MLRFIVMIVMLALPASAVAQPPADPLTTCLADSTSGKDRKELARWVFLAMAAHPEMRQHASASAATAADESSRTMAALVSRLLTESCVKEARAAMQSGQGSQALQLAFQGLGQLAMQELMTDKAVQGQMGLFERYLDQKRLTEAFSGK